MHVVVLAATVNLWAVFCPVATLLPQNQCDPTICCPSYSGCYDTCLAQTVNYCSPQCQSIADAGLRYTCIHNCNTQLGSCESWCSSNCPPGT